MSILSIMLFGVSAWSQSQSTSAPAAAMPAASPDFGAERDRISSAKSWIEYRYAETKHACYGKFLATRRIDKTRDVRYMELHSIREHKPALDEAGRADHAARRDRERVIREVRHDAGYPQREATEQKSRSEFESKQEQQRLNEAQHQVQAPQRVTNVQAAAKKQADYSAKLKTVWEQDITNAAKRAESAKQFQEKQQDAAKRQKELEERREQTRRRNQ